MGEMHQFIKKHIYWWSGTIGNNAQAEIMYKKNAYTYGTGIRKSARLQPLSKKCLCLFYILTCGYDPHQRDNKNKYATYLGRSIVTLMALCDVTK